MATPSTSGVLVTSLAGMNIGDYIACQYVASTSGSAGVFSGLGSAIGTELTYLGSATPNGGLYFVKADRGMLIADRIVQQSVTWDTLNVAKYIQGKPWDNGTIVPKMTSNTLPSGVASASSIYSGAYDAWYAFNRTDEAEGWASANGTTTGWLAYDFGTLKIVRSYSIKIGTTLTDRYPKDWTFEGSNDGTTWIVLDSQVGHSKWTLASQKKYFSFSNNTEYSKYRINITANTSGTGYVEINELGMYSEYCGVIRSLTGGVTYADASGSPVTTAPATLYGNWTLTNEWDTYIVNSTLNGKTIAGDDNTWHWNGIHCFTQDTPTIASSASNTRMTRGYNSVKDALTVASNGVNTIYGFRPVFEYNE